MAGTGRNEPCPCGSGKKYKNCCLNKDRARRVREGVWRRDEQATIDKLVAFAQGSSFDSQLRVASDLFWNGNYGFAGPEALDRREITRFLDWYLHDYRLEQSRKRVIDLFLEESGPKLLPSERERVLSWQKSYLGLYRILGVVKQSSLSVMDTLRGGEELVSSDGLGSTSLSGDLVLGRILRSLEPPYFSWSAILLPAEMEAGLVSFEQEAYRDYCERHIQATWPDFLSNTGYLFNHYLLRSAAESGSARRAAGLYYDASDTVQRLQEVERQLRERAARRVAEQQRAEQPEAEEEASWRRTQGGVLLPGYVQYEGGRKSKR